MDTLALLTKAKKEGYAIGAFNAANLETLKAITQAAAKLNSPIIIEASDGEVNFLGKKEAVALIQAFREELNIPITQVGEIMPKENGVTVLDEEDKVLKLKREGFEHFKDR